MSAGSLELAGRAEVSWLRVWPIRMGVIGAAFLGTAASLEWLRFGMSTPSLIDDWYAISYGRAAFHALVAGDYGSAHVDLAGRYRPAYSGIWNYVQWHLLTDPSVAGAAIWGGIRIVGFLTAIALLVRALAPRWRPAPLWLMCLAPLAVALTPQIAVDLARHSPAEPLMVTGLVIGLLGMAAGAQSMITSGRISVLNVTTVVVAFGFYLFGVYAKETSIAIVVLLPFVLKAYWRQIRAFAGPSGRARALTALVVLALAAPVIQLSTHLLHTSAQQAAYGEAQATAPRILFVAGVLPLLGAPGILGTLLWCVVVPVAITVAGQAVLRRDVQGWLLLGVLLTGFAMSALALGRGDSPSRYYIPWVVAVAAVATRSLATPNRKILGSAVGVAVFVVALTSTRGALARWAATERSGSTAVEMAEPIVSGGCPLYLAGFDVERRVAVPRLLRFIHSAPRRRCDATTRTAFALAWHSARLPSGFAHQCDGTWTVLEARNAVVLSRCRSFRSGHFLDQDEAAHLPMVAVTRLRVPAIGANPPTF